MKKQFILIVCMLSMAGLLAACGGGSGSGPATNVATSSAPASDMGAIQDSKPADATANVQDSSAETSGQEGQEAASSTAAAQVSSEEFNARMTGIIEPIIMNYGMQAGVTVVDVTTGERAVIGGDMQMPSASMIKIALVATFLQHVEEGKHSLDDLYTIQDGDIVGGTGSIGGHGVGAQLTYREIVERTIYESDNTGANILIETVGMDAVNDFARSKELTATSMNRLMMDEDALARGVDNFTSASDTATLLYEIAKHSLVSEEASSIMLSALEMQQDNLGIAQGLPAGTVFAHKTGSLTTVRNDGGIVEGGHPYVISIMCGADVVDAGAANSLMAEIAAAINPEFA